MGRFSDFLEWNDFMIDPPEQNLFSFHQDKTTDERTLFASLAGRDTPDLVWLILGKPEVAIWPGSNISKVAIG
mgnify:CR=1 FL=1